MRSALLALTLCAHCAAFADAPNAAPPAQTAVSATTTAPASAATFIVVTGTYVNPSAAASAVQPVAMPVHAIPTCEEIKAFKDKMHKAVDAALKYPAELKFRPATGVTIVTYDYVDGKTEDPRITQWSGDGRLDRAALAAVKNADFAAIRPGIGDKKIHDVVIIVFDNSANTDKNTKEQQQKKLDTAMQGCG